MGAETSEFIYNYPVQNSKKPGFTSVYRNKITLKEQLCSTLQPGAENMRDILLNSRQKVDQKRRCLGSVIVTLVQDQEGKQVESRTLREYSFEDVFNWAQCFAKAVLSKGLYFREKQRSMRLLGIYAKNRYEWTVADIGCILFGITTVPLYDTLGLQNLTFCMKQTQMTTLIVSAETLPVLLNLKDRGNLQNVITLDPLSEQLQSKLKVANLTLYNFQDLITFGKTATDIDHTSIKINGDSCLTFSYTSGTTGPPKGAMLSHRNFIALAASVQNEEMRLLPTDVHISYLPLPHMFERGFLLTCLTSCCFVAFYSGNVQKVKNDCQIVQPTVLVSVPRMWNKIAETVQDTFSKQTGLKHWIIQKGVDSKTETMRQTGEFQSGFYDSIIFSEVRKKFGGKLRLLISGSAPLRKETHQFIKTILCCPLIEGYGQTENTAAAFLQHSKDATLGQVGGVVTGLEFKLCDIKQMNYTSEDIIDGKHCPRGQIWLRGPQVFLGYYKMPEVTAETITSDGWLKTGDVGQFNPVNQGLMIIDRKKNIFKLQQGEYIAPEKLQAIFLKSDYLLEAFIHGDSSQNHLVLIAHPKEAAVKKLAEQLKIQGSSEDLCGNPVIRTQICKDLQIIGKKDGLNSLEIPKNLYLSTKSFVDLKLTTNTMKLQRFQVRTYFKDVIKQLYAEDELNLKA